MGDELDRKIKELVRQQVHPYDPEPITIYEKDVAKHLTAFAHQIVLVVRETERLNKLT